MNALPCFRLLTATLLLALASVSTLAQSKKAPIVFHEGSWVVEWTPKSRQCIVRFYNNLHQLIYEETVNRKLNITRRKTKSSLNTALEQAMFVWNATHKVPTDRQWVAAQFSNK